MKNWIWIEHGSLINGVSWTVDGYALIDPNAIISISSWRTQEAFCTIHMMSGLTYTVSKSYKNMIIEVQENLK